MRSRDSLQLPFDDGRQIFSVSSLNREARLLIEGTLGTVWVEGEVSNLSRPSSGHLYWSLKDAQAQIRCAMFRQHNRSLNFELDNGKQILVRGRVSLYEARGEYQLIVEYVEEAGEGVLRRRFEELKRKLAAEGLFDAARKRQPPALPLRIGVVTSPTGAALRDVLTALRRRFPATAVLIYPTSVQGEGAAEEISRTLRLAERRAECDLLILTRGGGSLEDLWAFNEEIVARSIAALQIPVIVGVGHETDFTIADFVADVRAPTPSQAAELAVPNQAEWLAHFTRAERHLEQAVRRHFVVDARRIATLAHRLQRCHPGVPVREFGQRLDELEARLQRGLERLVGARKMQFARLAAAVSGANPRHRVARVRERWRWADENLQRAVGKRVEQTRQRLRLAERSLNSLSPLATLQRGYAIVSRQDDRRIVTDAASAGAGTAVAIRLARGELAATVDSVTKPGE
ncbi:MAG TPA: exodeoxyribonuclease VII large subunit [Gammaproteobacteria bacterium]|nr:exodeoxyribonuclease VII large subunit [Gammaproteobacteria bacterium]